METDLEARQGPRGRPVLLVLGGSVILLGLYLAGMLIWTVVSTPVSPREETAGATPTLTGDLRPSTETNQSAIPPANPAYPAPVEE